ncbi:MAG: MFS transporter [bacterium]
METQKSSAILSRDAKRGYSYTPKERMAILAASILGSSMAFVNGTAVTLALDPIQASLQASLGSMLWIASIYMLFLASLMLIGGALGDFYGRRAVFAWGVGIFSASSLACALAPDEGLLIAARAGQGIGAALLTPMSLTLIADAFEKEHRGTAIGLWSSASALMTAMGPPLGGWIAEHISWRGIFYINLPLGIGALLITLFLTKSKPPRRKPENVDWQGALLAVLGCAGVSYGLIALSEATNKSLFSLSAFLWAVPIAVGLIAMGLLVRVERRAQSPMAPPALFTSDIFNAVNIVTILIYGAMGGIFVFYPIVLKDAYGHGVDQTGIAFLGFALPMAVLTMMAGYLMRRFGVRAMLASGSLVAAVAFASMAFLPWSGTMAGAFFSMLIFGIGMALLAPAMTTAIFNATPEESHGAASGINNAFARAATLFAIVGFGAIAAIAYDQVAGPVASIVGYGNGENLTGIDAINYKHAMIASLKALVWVSIALALCSAGVAAWFISGDIEKGEVKAEVRHQVFGFLRMFETAPTQEEDLPPSPDYGSSEE